jgi:hypothetical protein
MDDELADQMENHSENMMEKRLVDLLAASMDYLWDGWMVGYLANSMVSWRVGQLVEV